MTYPGNVDLLGAEEVVFDWTTDACEAENIPDGPARAFRDASGKINLQILHYYNYRMTGPDFDNLSMDCNSNFTSDLDTIASNFNDHEWISCTYTFDGVNIMAVVHNEHHAFAYGQCDDTTSQAALMCWYNTMTYATSSDSGKTFTHPPAPNHYLFGAPYQFDPSGSGAHGLFEGSNIIRNPKDGYYYRITKAEAHQAQAVGPCLVRTPNPMDPTAWRGWDGEGFNVSFADPYRTPGINPEDHILQPIGQGFIEKMNMSISWNTYFNKFVLVGAAQKSGVWGIYYALSDDLIHWTARRRIMQGNMLINPNKSNTEDIIAYPSLIDHADTSRNFEITGQEAYLYFVRWHQTSGLYDRDLIRIPIRFNKLEVSGWTINAAGQLYDNNPGDGICATSAGKCNLNAAFQESNSRLPADSNFVVLIEFNSPSVNIKAKDQLFGLQYPTVLDATGMSSYQQNTTSFGNPMDFQPGVTINLNGNGGIYFGAKNSGIRGLALRNYSGAAVGLSGDSSFVESCILGSNAEGLSEEVKETDGRGINVENASHIRIGGSNASQRNMILGGIVINGQNSYDVEIKGNYIGTDRNGDQVFYTNTGGITLSNGAHEVEIGGESSNEGNVISGHVAPGISIDPNSSDIRIQNNLIGTDVTGIQDRGNQRAGISIGTNVSRVDILKNIIAANSGDEAGIWAIGAVQDINIQGNFIGTDKTGTVDLGNGSLEGRGSGMVFGSGATDILIGGQQSGEANVIAFNRGHGIDIFGNSGNAIQVSGNRIYNNVRLGLKIGGIYYVDSNDDRDQDSGANDLQNCPVIETASFNGSEISIIGNLNSEPNQNFRLEFFINDSCDDFSPGETELAHGEGEELIVVDSVSTDLNGNATFQVIVPYANALNHFVTATVTNPNLSTSEFSPCIEVLAPAASMTLSTHAFLETVPLGGTSEDTLFISSTGTDAINWNIESQSSWLTTDPVNGNISAGDSASILIQYNTIGLVAGTYNDTLLLSSNDASQPSIGMPVEIFVQAQPEIHLGFDTMKVNIPLEGLAVKQFDIENQGADPLNWQLATQAGISWLHQVQPNSGTIPGYSTGTATLKFQDNSLSPGTYYGAAWISSNDPDEPQSLFTIELTVSSGSGDGGSQPNLSFSTGKQNYCEGDSILLSYQVQNTGLNANNKLRISLSAPDGNFNEPRLLAEIPTILPSGILAMKLPEELPKGNQYAFRLESTSPYVIASKDVPGITIANIPDVSLSVFPQLCENDASIILTGGSPFGGQYNLNDLVIEAFNPSIYEPGNHLISYLFTSQEGCVASTSANLQVLASPEVDIQDELPVCAGVEEVGLKGFPEGGIFWGEGVDSSMFNPAKPGTYFISYQYSNGTCADTAEMEFTVFPIPEEPIITLTGSELQLALEYEEIIWYKDNEVIVGANGNTYNPTSSGNYHVEVKNNHGCSNQSTSVLWQTTHIDPELQASWTLFPNPAKEKVQLKWQNLEVSFEGKCLIFDPAGKLVRELNISPLKNELNLNLEGWVPGMYLIEVRDETRRSQRKLIVKE